MNNNGTNGLLGLLISLGMIMDNDKAVEYNIKLEKFFIDINEL